MGGFQWEKSGFVKLMMTQRVAAVYCLQLVETRLIHTFFYRVHFCFDVNSDCVVATSFFGSFAPNRPEKLKSGVKTSAIFVIIFVVSSLQSYNELIKADCKWLMS